MGENGRLRGRGGSQAPFAEAAGVLIGPYRDLVLRRRLPRQAEIEALVRRLVDRRPAQVWGVSKIERDGVVERTGRMLVNAPVAIRAEEPERVFPKRTADGGVEIPVPGQCGGLGGGRHVAGGLQAVVGEVGEHETVELVPALLRNRIVPDA